MAIDTVFLDAGGVLVFPNWTRVAEALARHGVEAEARALAEGEPHAKHEMDVAPGVAAARSDHQRGWVYFNLVLAHAGVQQSAATDAALRDLQAYHEHYNLWEFVPDDVPPALDALRAMGLRLVVVSNANGKLRALFDRIGLTPRVDLLFDSHEEGVEKPDPRLFQIALARAGARADHTVHIGDLYHIDVVGARAAGLRAVLLDTAGLYPNADCPRIRALGELVGLIGGEGSG
jgi:putative hydrolase of the HAD superfamily